MRATSLDLFSGPAGIHFGPPLLHWFCALRSALLPECRPEARDHPL